MKQSGQELFNIAVRAAAPLIIARSYQPSRDVNTLVHHVVNQCAHPEEDGGERTPAAYQWSLSGGLRLLNADKVDETVSDSFESDPAGMLQWLMQQSGAMVFTNNIDVLLGNPMTTDIIYHGFGEYGLAKENGSSLILIGPDTDSVPSYISSSAINVTMELPNADQRRAIIAKTAKEIMELTLNPDDMATLVDASASLTTFEIEQALACAYVSMPDEEDSDEEPDPTDACAEYLRETVKQKLKRIGCLRWLETTETLDDVVGFSDAKTYLTTATQPQEDPRLNFRGALFLGVPGAGKSMIAKALGNTLSIPTILFDVSALLNSLVGQSEQNLREALAAIDQIGRCVLIIDEIEKALGQSGERDGGVMARLLGVLLTWMNDRHALAIIMATCNDMSKLPPEFTRAQRWDVIYFVDIPDKAQIEALVELYGDSYGIADEAKGLLKHAKDWTGAEVEQAVRQMKQLDCDPQDAAGRIVPISTRLADRLEKLRDFASTGCVDVETGQPYRKNKMAQAATGGRSKPRAGAKKKATRRPNNPLDN